MFNVCCCSSGVGIGCIGRGCASVIYNFILVIIVAIAAPVAVVSSFIVVVDVSHELSLYHIN